MKKWENVLLHLTTAICWRDRHYCILRHRIWKNLQLSWAVCDRQRRTCRWKSVRRKTQGRANLGGNLIFATNGRV
jgi:hypothetical protein